MLQFIPMIIGIPFIGFWFWMLADLSNNKYISPDAKRNWFLWFIFLNIFTAIWYYYVEYRPRHV